jgi:hypothetical protein
MYDQRPKDCVCSYPHVQHTIETGHALFCPAHDRLSARHAKKREKFDEWFRCAQRDMEGRAFCGGYTLDESDFNELYRHEPGNRKQ